MKMNKEFVPYTLALELKALRFDEPCFGHYLMKKFYLKKYDKQSDGITLRPTFSQAFRWFREKYNISYSIDWMTRSNDYYSGYIVHFRGINNYKLNGDNFIVLNDELPPQGYGVYKTYEEAELACLIKLIQIIKDGKVQTN